MALCSKALKIKTHQVQLLQKERGLESARVEWGAGGLNITPLIAPLGMSAPGGGALPEP